MENIGQYLKQEREKQHKTINDIVSSTRISRSVLEAIEHNDHAALPPLQYLKGLVRLYAKELNLDEDEVVDQYEKEFQGQKTSEFKVLRELEATKNEKKQFFGYGVVIVLILVLAAGMYAVQNYYEEGKKTFQEVYPEVALDILSEEKEPEVVDREEIFIPQPVEPEKKPAAEEVSEVETVEAPVVETVPVEEQFTIRFSARELTWIRIEVDDRPAFEIMLRAGESFRQRAEETMAVRIGNAAGVSVYFNDKPVTLNGEQGIPVDLVFPEDARAE